MAMHNWPPGGAAFGDLKIQHRGNLAGHCRPARRTAPDQGRILDNGLRIGGAAGITAGSAVNLRQNRINLVDLWISFYF